VVEQGTHKPVDLTLCFPEWELIGKLLSYRVYRRSNQERITPIERIPESTRQRAFRSGLAAQSPRLGSTSVCISRERNLATDRG
jgi:hypothetical protein